VQGVCFGSFVDGVLSIVGWEVEAEFTFGGSAPRPTDQDGAMSEAHSISCTLLECL